ncbi:hypothetical protein CR51_36245 [Caballeronia megalochromosomata]|nr:hypothetical protein CR51_36245 [Caballeronia megalochromosomata]
MKLVTRLTILMQRGGLLLIGLGGWLAGRAAHHHDAAAQAARLPPELADIDPDTLAAWRRAGAPMHWLALVARESPAYLRAGPAGTRAGSGAHDARPPQVYGDGPAKAPGVASPNGLRREVAMANEAPDTGRTRSSVARSEVHDEAPNRRAANASPKEPSSLQFSGKRAARMAHVQAPSAASQAPAAVRSQAPGVNAIAAGSAGTGVGAGATQPTYLEPPRSETPQARTPQAPRHPRHDDTAPGDTDTGVSARPPTPSAPSDAPAYPQAPGSAPRRRVLDEPPFPPARIPDGDFVDCSGADDPAIASTREALSEPLFAPVSGPVTVHRAHESSAPQSAHIRPLPEQPARDLWPALPGRGVRETSHWRRAQREAAALRELDAEQREVTWNALRF